jgi:hypothetical protein
MTDAPLRLFTILLRENRTGEVRGINAPEHVETDFTEPLLVDAKLIAFNWFENNFACDCNRQFLFADEYGQDDLEVACGDTLFSARMIDQSTGEVFAEDGDWGLPDQGEGR